MCNSLYGFGPAYKLIVQGSQNKGLSTVSGQDQRAIFRLLCRSRAVPTLLLGLFIGVVAAGEHVPVVPFSHCPPVRQLFAPDVTRKLDAQLERVMEENNFPSVEVEILVPGRGRYSFVQGTANIAAGIPRKRNEPFRIASITKPFAATAILVLVDRGNTL
jgi:CubicO group peptidase (beta-lactamase class C family)